MKNSEEKRKRSKVSAGLLMFRFEEGKLQVFLVHPGGPFWAKKDRGAWSIPKGEVEEGDSPQETALREFKEETGIEPEGELFYLGMVKQKGGKLVHAWAFEGDYDESVPLRSNVFTMEFPPHSGKIREFPEVDRASFFDSEESKLKINPAQVELIERLIEIISNRNRGDK